MRVLILLMLLVVFAGCNEAVETTEKGGAGAVGIAETMSGGTIGDTDMESGDSPEEQAEAGAGEEGSDDSEGGGEEGGGE
jgi:hypothetical protein